VRREYGPDRAALIGAGVVHGRAWTGAGTWAGLTRRGRVGRRATACQPRSSTWHIASALVPTPIGSKSSRIWARSYCKICSLGYALSFLCGSREVFGRVQRVVALSSRECLAAASRGKSMPRSCQTSGICLQILPRRAEGNLAPICYLDLADLSLGTR
jgi:hypothetical protein